MFLQEQTPQAKLNSSQAEVQTGIMHTFQSLYRAQSGMAQMLVIYREHSKTLSEHGRPSTSPGHCQLCSFLLVVTQGIRYSFSEVHLFPC